MNEDLVADSGYVVPHGVMAMHGKVLAPMIGAATDSTAPGGIVELDDKSGEFERYFGPGPARTPGGLEPKYMYDFAMLPGANRGISTTFGPPALCGGGIDPTCLGDEVAVWDFKREKVIQTADLGANNGALMVRFVTAHGVRRAFINTPGTNAVWLADDDDHDGVFDFQQVLGPDDGLLIPADLLLSYDGRYMYVTNWFADTVQQYDITDPFEPKLNSTVSLPHPNMLRLSTGQPAAVRHELAALDLGRRHSLRAGPQRRVRPVELRRRSGDREADLVHARRELLGQLRERAEEDHDRPGRRAHDALRPVGAARAGRALRSDDEAAHQRPGRGRRRSGGRPAEPGAPDRRGPEVEPAGILPSRALCRLDEREGASPPA